MCRGERRLSALRLLGGQLLPRSASGQCIKKPHRNVGLGWVMHHGKRLLNVVLDGKVPALQDSEEFILVIEAARQA